MTIQVVSAMTIPIVSTMTNPTVSTITKLIGRTMANPIVIII